MTDDGVRFDAGPRTVAAFLGALTAYAVVVNRFEESVWNTGIAAAAIVGGLWTVAIVLTVEWVLRREGVSLAVLLPARREVWAALAAFLSVWVAVNGVHVLVGLWLDVPVRDGGLLRSPLLAVGVFVADVVFTGLPEELAFRGYLQNRLVDAVPPGVFAHGLAVLLAAALFAVWHVPDRAIGIGFGPVETFRSVVWVFFDTVLVFALAYELTRNVVFVALVHAFVNESVLAVAVASPDPTVALSVHASIAAATAVASLAYRRWVVYTTGAPPGLDGPGAYRESLAGADAE